MLRSGAKAEDPLQLAAVGQIKDDSMHFDERNEGDYRIYAGAIEAPSGDGYLAAVVVKRIRGETTHTGAEAFRDESLACGHRWAEPEGALAYAITKALKLIRSEPAALRC